MKPQRIGTPVRVIGTGETGTVVGIGWDKDWGVIEPFRNNNGIHRVQIDGKEERYEYLWPHEIETMGGAKDEDF